MAIALGLLEHCERLYIGGSDQDRRALNQAFFAALEMDPDGVRRAILNPPFAELTDLSIGLADEDHGDEPPDPDEPAPIGPSQQAYLAYHRSRRPKNPSREPRRVVAASRGPERTNPEGRGSRGSNVTLLAERAGFEPATHLSAGTRFPVALLRPTRTPLRARSEYPAFSGTWVSTPSCRPSAQTHRRQSPRSWKRAPQAVP